MTSTPESTPEPSRTSAREVALRLAGHGIRASDAYGRPDLAARLRELCDRTADPTVRVIVAGEFKHGKSSLVNALAGRDLCPVDDDVATAVATAVAYANGESATAIVLDGDGSLRRERIEIGSLAAWVTESGAEVDAHDVQLVEVRAPADALRDGLVLVDLPGVGGLGSAQGALTRAALPSARAVLFVTDSAQELTATELELLQAIAGEAVLVALVESKIDLQPAWRRVAGADATTVAGSIAGPFPVSSELARLARERDDPGLAAESGLPPLVNWLCDDVVAGAARRGAALLAEAVESVAEQLSQPFEAELALLEHPDRAGELAASIERSESELGRVRSAAARWRTVFTDAFADVTNDLDHDLRARLRELLREAEQALDQLDPAKSWESYEPEVRRDLARVIGDHYTMLDARVSEVAHAVASVLVEDSEALEAWVSDAARPKAAGEIPAARPGESVKKPDATRPGLAGQGLTLLRSSYGGALMAGFVASAIGFPVAAPAVLAVGVALGARGLRQESQRLLSQRRAQAKTAVRTHVDEVSFTVLKDSRDRVRYAQRHLRDFFGSRADELARSAAETLQAARDAAHRDASERETRVRDIRAELERLSRLAQAAAEARAALAGGPVS